MTKIAVYTRADECPPVYPSNRASSEGAYANRDTQICDFFEAEKFLIYKKKESSNGIWDKVNEIGFDKITPSTPAITRKNVETLLPLINEYGCTIIAGGGLYGIPFTVFDMAGLHIFEIKEINGETFDGIIEDLQQADAAAAKKEAVIKDTKPVETETPGVYFLDLVALQKEYPEISSKKAMMDFLANTPFMELRLVCKHIPPWIENAGSYNAETLNDKDGVVTALITKNCKC